MDARDILEQKGALADQQRSKHGATAATADRAGMSQRTGGLTDRLGRSPVPVVVRRRQRCLVVRTAADASDLLRQGILGRVCPRSDRGLTGV